MYSKFFNKSVCEDSNWTVQLKSNKYSLKY